MAKFVAEGVRDDDPRVLKNPKWKHLKDNGRYEKITIHFENASEDNRARRLSKVESDQVEVEVAEGEGTNPESENSSIEFLTLRL